jgi:hypothetical protein
MGSEEVGGAMSDLILATRQIVNSLWPLFIFPIGFIFGLKLIEAYLDRLKVPMSITENEARARPEDMTLAEAFQWAQSADDQTDGSTDPVNIDLPERCSYCHTKLSQTDLKCPHCGAPT